MRGNPHRRARGFFSTDVGLAALVIMLATFVCVLSLKTTAESLAWDARTGLAESSALRLADYLLKQCEPPGLSECDGQFAYSHLLSQSKAQALKEKWGAFEAMRPGKEMSARIIGLDGETIAEAGNATADGAACVRRPAMMGGREVVLEACSQ